MIKLTKTQARALMIPIDAAALAFITHKDEASYWQLHEALANLPPDNVYAYPKLMKEAVQTYQTHMRMYANNLPKMTNGE